jgi:signal transduction histidine kinase
MTCSWLVVLVLAGCGLYRNRMNRLLAIERVRAQIAADLHDDIGSTLSQISILGEVLRQKAETSCRGCLDVESLSRIATASREALDSLSDIVWAIDPRRDHLRDLIQRSRRFASDVFTARDIALRFSVPHEGEDVPLDADVRRDLYLMLKEGVNNSARHSGCTAASVGFSIEEGWLVARVEDNGIGFDLSRETDGHGLTSLRARALRIGGALTVESAPAAGTSIELRIRPGARAHWLSDVRRRTLDGLVALLKRCSGAPFWRRKAAPSSLRLARASASGVLPSFR